MDVPKHSWKIFGSYATRSQDAKSDFDVVLCGVSRADLEHPYFEDLLQHLRQSSVEEGKHLDLFLDQPEKNRLESVFSPEDRAIDAGPEFYKAIHSTARVVEEIDIRRSLAYLSTQCRESITSQEEFLERQQDKTDRMRAVMKALEAKDGGLSGKGATEISGVDQSVKSRN